MPQAKGLDNVQIIVDPSQSVDTGTLLLGGLSDANQDSTLQATLIRDGTVQLGGVKYLSVSAGSVGNTRFIESFVRISQALVALLLGILGGFAGHIIRSHAMPSASAPNSAARN